MAERAQVVVVGSGPPGAAAALFLSRAGADVLVLEAGSRDAARGLTVRIGGFTVLKRRRELKQRPRFEATADREVELFEELAPGGLTNHWSCAVPRFSEEDFDDATRAGEAFAWPIGYDDVAPWYDQVEPLLRIAGAVTGGDQLPSGQVKRARHLRAAWAPVGVRARAMGRTLAPMPYTYGAETTVTFSGTVFNSFVRLLEPELDANRIKARFGARVVRLRWSSKSGRVEGVCFRDEARGVEEEVPCRAVVLAAGAIRTSEILLASRSSDFPEGLGNTHGVLGHYLHDHPLGKLEIDLGSPMPIFPPCYLTRPALDRAPPLYAAACMQWSGLEPVLRSFARGTPGLLPQIGFSVFGTMAPSPDNRVTLKGQTPDGDSPTVQIHIRRPPEALTALERARDDLLQLLEESGLHPRTRTWHVEHTGSSKHFGGTCRMHASPRFGMLDAWSRMHAVPNVAVADSAAFTTGPEKNPVLTSMALAARAGDRLAKDLHHGRL